MNKKDNLGGKVIVTKYGEAGLDGFLPFLMVLMGIASRCTFQRDGKILILLILEGR